MSPRPFRSPAAYAKAILWGLRSWRKGDALLRQDYERFKASGLRLEDFLESPLWYLRNIGVKMIGKYRLESFYPVLLEKLSDRSEAPILRRNCAEMIGSLNLKRSEAKDTIRKALADPYWEVRTEALKALCAVDEPGEPASSVLINTFFVSLPSEAGRSVAVPESCREANFEVRAMLACALGRLGVEKSALSALGVLAADSNWIVRAQAAVALAELAARTPDLRRDCQEILESINALSDGAVPSFVIKETLQKAGQLFAKPDSFPAPTEIWPMYLRLKEGWNKGAAARS